MGYGSFPNRQFSDETVRNFKSDYVHPKPERKRCVSCGYKIGGDNHENGAEHLKGKKNREK